MRDNFSRDLESVVDQLVEVGARVTVTPLIRRGKLKISRIESRLLLGSRACQKKAKATRKRCTFTVSQVLCIRIPLTFGVEVDVGRGTILRCGKLDLRRCTVGVDLPPPRRYKLGHRKPLKILHNASE